MDGASDGWTRVWLAPFLLLSMRGGDLYGHELPERLDELGFGETRPGEVYLEPLAHALDRYRREIERFFLLYEGQPVYEVRR